MKWLTSAIFLGLAAWALVTFTACAKAKTCRQKGWEMPNGMLCERKFIYQGKEIFRECSDGREYVDPWVVMHVEVCE